MILHSLADYYQALEAQGGVSRPGWAKVKVSYALEIDENGGLVDILPLEREMELPERERKSADITSCFLCDDRRYILGIPESNEKRFIDKAKKAFEDSQRRYAKILSGTDCKEARSILKFFSTWNEQKEKCNKDLSSIDPKVTITFFTNSHFADEVKEIKSAWEKYYWQSIDTEKRRCMITGNIDSICRIHPSFNVAGGTNPKLVSFDKESNSLCSYGKDGQQGLNAQIGSMAAAKYGIALKSLLSNKEHYKRMGADTVVYWAEDADTQTQDAFACILDGGDTVSNADLDGFMSAISQGKNAYWNGLPVKSENHFYILALSPNQGRLSVRFYLCDTFESIVKHIKEHYDRLEVAADGRGKRGPIPLWALLRETVNPKSSSKAASPQMAGDTLRAILTGGPYPATLYQQTQLRIRSDRNIPHEKAAIIKAYLIKNTQNEKNKEALTVELNETTTYQPYILGRLFSVLEAIQLKANPGINSTIKDKYFTSACATPSVVFPTLLKLAESHMKKLEAGMRIYYAKQLGGLTSMLTESFPAHMNLNDQGIFQLGYYHQTQKRFEKKDKTETAEIK